MVVLCEKLTHPLTQLQIIVCANGEAGINFEHTGVDGHTVLRYAAGESDPRSRKASRELTLNRVGKMSTPSLSCSLPR
jgi:hypothetical protein